MNVPKRHHYLPQFYLEGFSRNGQLCVFDRKEGDFRRQQPKDTGVERAFLTVEQVEPGKVAEVERLFADLEGRSKPLIERLEKGEILPGESKATLALFLGFMFVRTPAFRMRTMRPRNSLFA